MKAGYQVFVLRYSIKQDAQWPNPLEDYETAMELIRSKEEEWKLFPDKIAVIGFSAGGHLGACAAAMSKNRPNAAILGYAVTLGDMAKGCNATAPDVVSAVDKDTCPCFLFATRNDNVVPVINSVKFMEALIEKDISFESHIYAYGPHGFSTCDTSVQSVNTQVCERVPHWVEDSIGWLKDVLGEFGDGMMTKPACKVHITGDSEAFLSTDCTMGRLLGNPVAKELLEPILQGMAQGNGADAEQGDMSLMVQGMKLKDILSYANAPAEMTEGLEKQLMEIPNI